MNHSIPYILQAARVHVVGNKQDTLDLADLVQGVRDGTTDLDTLDYWLMMAGCMDRVVIWSGFRD